ncbi:type II and III secretion system protein family protein [Aestuariispira insulae]|uniref:Pilus assembly protein CpaC n=1 Tax=Aestuariispira insulae TaxID=1461337 RepID=A0A3D9HNH4_9PROT|nr:type II and III secretion system protein family protein [Aestuariispira insulae]RED50851.1 pilus assembly protein CpaC [Aestuariispira insulae]
MKKFSVIKIAAALLLSQPVFLPGALGQAELEVLSGANRTLQVETSQGRLIRLPGRAETVFIADPTVADIQVKSPSLVYLSALKPGGTTLFAVDRNEQLLAQVTIKVTPDLVQLRHEIRTLYPDYDIAVSAVGSNVLVRGTVDSPLDAENIRRLAERTAGAPEVVLNQLNVASAGQINLRVRVAEITRDVQKQIGFNWTASKGGSFALSTFNTFNSNITQNTLTLAGNLGAFSLNTVIDALEQEGLLKILAEPNLTALTGETASFLAGGEFPILVPDSDGSVTIEFKQFGVSLAFTPTLITGGRINLHVRPEVSQLDNTNAVVLDTFQVPGLTTRRAETTVELGSGESFAIAGLIRNDVTHDVNKFPGLGDIPILGALFRSDDFQRDESELVIVVTPYVVKPVSSRRLALPTDGFAPTSDVERLLGKGMQRRNREVGEGVIVNEMGERVIGPVGFEFE